MAAPLESRMETIEPKICSLQLFCRTNTRWPWYAHLEAATWRVVRQPDSFIGCVFAGRNLSGLHLTPTHGRRCSPPNLNYAESTGENPVHLRGTCSSAGTRLFLSDAACLLSLSLTLAGLSGFCYLLSVSSAPPFSLCFFLFLPSDCLRGLRTSPALFRSANYKTLSNGSGN